MELFDSLTVDENVALGREAGLAGSQPAAPAVRRPPDRAPRSPGRRRRGARALRHRSDLGRRCGRPLSTGQRRLVELARACAGGYRLLLLDEPSSGLDRDETERFGEILRPMVDERGLGILLVEHDMAWS